MLMAGVQQVGWVVAGETLEAMVALEVVLR